MIIVNLVPFYKQGSQPNFLRHAHKPHQQDGLGAGGVQVRSQNCSFISCFFLLPFGSTNVPKLLGCICHHYLKIDNEFRLNFLRFSKFQEFNSETLGKG